MTKRQWAGIEEDSAAVQWFGIDRDSATARSLLAHGHGALETTEIKALLELLDTEIEVRADHEDMAPLEALFAKLRGVAEDSP